MDIVLPTRRVVLASDALPSRPARELAERLRPVRVRVPSTSARVQRRSAPQPQAMPKAMAIEGVESRPGIDAADARNFWSFLKRGRLVHARGLATRALGTHGFGKIATTLRAGGRGEVAGTIAA